MMVRYASILLLCLVSALYAEKTAYVNTFDIRSKLKEYQEAQETLKKETQEWETKAKELKKEIEDMQQELEKQKLLLNPQKVKERDDMILSKKLEYQTFLNSIWGENGKVVQREKELTKPIVDKILNAIKEVAYEEKCTLVLDVYQSNVVYAEKEMDLTELVIKKLTQKVE
ncbi:MAG: OmpH family outer membrane protein [Candidatus Delongbacteria bacterium]|nr:OmpH family outer membrane protein [Candidatus Delongbacteria bacterium]